MPVELHGRWRSGCCTAGADSLLWWPADTSLVGLLGEGLVFLSFSGDGSSVSMAVRWWLKGDCGWGYGSLVGWV